MNPVINEQLYNSEPIPDPTPLLRSPPEEPEEELTEEELNLKQLKEKAQKCKLIALDKMGYHPINTNGSNLHRNKKKELLEMMKVLFEKSDEEINKEFNDIVCEVVFDASNDYSEYPVYKRSYKIEKSKNILGESIEKLTLQDKN